MNFAKLISNKSSFQDKVLKAVEILSSPVVSTLGPDGVPILLEKDDGTVVSTKDGVTVASMVYVKDPEINAIITAIKEAAFKTNVLAGDGTTTAIVLTQALIKESQPYLKTNAITPQKLADSLIKICEEIKENLIKLAIPINSQLEKIRNVAYISCNGDKEVSDVVAKAIDTVGSDGVITLEDSLSDETTFKLEEGFAIKRGYGHLGPWAERILVNRKDLNQVIFEKPLVLIYDGYLENVKDLFNSVNKITCNGQRDVSLVIFAHDFSDQIKQFVAVNAANGLLRILPVKIPKLGAKHSQSMVLEDIAILTNGTMIIPGSNTLNDVENEKSPFLGTVGKIVSSRKETILYHGAGKPELIKDRVEWLRQQIKEAPNEWEKDILRERLGRLVGGIVVIGVGGYTQLEVKEKKDRIEDALNATRAALEEGIVAGGGSALLKAFLDLSEPTESQYIPYSILKKVVQYPLRQIIDNGGFQSADVVLDAVARNLESGLPYTGYDARARKIVSDLVSEGVIDPLKVVKTALDNAVSIACTLLRGGGSIVFSENKKNDDAMSFDNNEEVE